MKKIVQTVILLCLVAGKISAQVFPSENAILHYRIVGFSFNSREGASGYVLEVADGTVTDETTFAEQRILTKEAGTNKVTAEVPYFGSGYTWRVITKTAKGEKSSPLYHFRTLAGPMVDSNEARLRIVTGAANYHDAFVFMDCSRALYDMNGKMVWFLPDHLAPETGVQDMKATSRGTITYLYHGHFYEVSYDGKIIIDIPGNSNGSGVANAEMHHEGTRLANGHYMVLGNEQVSWKGTGEDMIIKHTHDSSEGFKGAPFGTLNEYDEKGNLVWQFHPGDYFLKSDVMKWKPVGKNPLQVHSNAFYFDEANSVVYLGFRNVSRILKVHYPDGKVMAAFGKKYTGAPGEDLLGVPLFCEQHAMVTRGGKLYLFNNNGCNPAPMPRVLVMEEDAAAPSGLKTVWEYEPPRGLMDVVRSGGGNVLALPDGAVFFSMSMPYNDIMIVDKNKKILWDAKPEKRDCTTGAWKDLTTYRASLISSAQDMQNMVWYGR